MRRLSLSALLTPRRRLVAVAASLTVLGLWLLPFALGSWDIAGLVVASLIGAVLWGWLAHQWRPLILLATFSAVIDLFGLVHLAPMVAGGAIAVLWIAGLWLVGHIDRAQPQIFHQALSSFLVVEVFVVLQLWPINVLSKSVIVVAFAFILWHELVRSVSPARQLWESVIPFFLIVALMTLTARWLTF